MKILLTNDDGIYAQGLWSLYKRFIQRHDVTVIAPDRERSAVSHGITLHDPIRASKISANGLTGYAVSGTPVDCIKLGILELLAARPDIVVSGINPGANVGVNINYSGTVAAAREATLYGVPAIAVSVCGRQTNNYDPVARFIEDLAVNVLQKGLPFGTLLNVNFPDMEAGKFAGVYISKQGARLFPEYFEKRKDPRKRVYYWQGYKSQSDFESPDIDAAAICDNFISITPIKCDMTDYNMLEDLKTWGWGKKG
ncbi:MAG: 5'/3'-nucleotidase SurE [Deltaproteobacteria bacterium]|nr:5'/3'-nucleotidase SurE [Deltaproteobacteria bacterium]